MSIYWWHSQMDSWSKGTLVVDWLSKASKDLVILTDLTSRTLTWMDRLIKQLTSSRWTSNVTRFRPWNSLMNGSESQWKEVKSKDERLLTRYSSTLEAHSQMAPTHLRKLRKKHSWRLRRHKKSRIWSSRQTTRRWASVSHLKKMWQDKPWRSSIQTKVATMQSTYNLDRPLWGERRLSKLRVTSKGDQMLEVQNQACSGRTKVKMKTLSPRTTFFWLHRATRLQL